jgi:hypothetical protein
LVFDDRQQLSTEIEMSLGKTFMFIVQIFCRNSAGSFRKQVNVEELEILDLPDNVSYGVQLTGL